MAAWKVHLSKLSPVEREIFEKQGKGDLNFYTATIERFCEKQNKESRGLKIANFFRPWFRIANQYAPIAQTMIQADPTSSALVLGGITCIMSISERYSQFPEKISEMLASMGEKIGLLNEYGSEIYMNNDAVQGAIVEIFGDILQFCRLALEFFRKRDGKERASGFAFGKALVSSFQDHFGPIIKKYEADLQMFEEKVKLCERRHDRNSRTLQTVQAQAQRHHLLQIEHLGTELMSFRTEYAAAIADEHQFVFHQHNQMRLIEARREQLEMQRERGSTFMQ